MSTKKQQRSQSTRIGLQLKTGTVLLMLLIALSTAGPSAAAPATTTANHGITSTTASAVKPTTSASTTLVSSPTPDFILPTPATPQPTSTTGANALACPPPMVFNTLNLTSGSCIGSCCLPCPASSIFYEPNKLENIYTLTSIFRAISATAGAFLLACYLILPSRRKHPHLIVLCFTALVVPWEGLGTIWLYKKEKLLCKSVFEIATMSNSWLCGLQGIGLMYLVLVMLCLASLLITNLHFLTVYRSTLIHSYMSQLIVFSFLLPLSLVLPVSIRRQIENPGFGSICFVSAEVASPYFFYPLSVILCIATLIHLGTIAYMIRTNIKANSGSIGDSTSCNPSESLSNSSKVLSKRQRRLQTARDISLLLKQQWRPGLFALFLLITDMIYWLFYFVEAKKLETVSPTTSWFVEWTQCLAQQAAISIKIGTLSLTTVPTVEQLKMAGDAAQAACASIARPYVPSFSWAALSDIMPATFGITVLAIFGTKLELWQDLKLRLSGGRDTTVFLMGDITKETKDRHQHQQKQQQEQQGQSKKVQQTDMKQDDGFYSQDLEMDQTDYNSHDILTSLPEAAAAPAGHYRNNLTRSGSQTAAATPLSPTSHVSFTDTKVGYGGPTRKASTRTEDNRENIYYRNPVHGGSPHQQRAKLVSEGSEPWPSWPSTTAVVTSITYHGRPPLTIETHDQGSHGQSRSSVYAPTSATSQAVSPSSRGFYNSDDLSQASPSIYPDQRSGHEQQQQQQFSWSQNQSPTTRTLSPPPVPQKSGRRRI